MTGPSFFDFSLIWTSYLDASRSRPTSKARIYLEVDHKLPEDGKLTESRIPHRIAQRKLFNVLQTLLLIVSKTFVLFLGLIFLPPGLRIVLCSADLLLLERIEKRSNWGPVARRRPA